MSRSSISYLGIALLLWMGIVLPSAQQPLLDIEDTSSIESVFRAASAPDGQLPPAPAKHYIGSPSCSADADLSDMTIALCPVVATDVSFWSSFVVTADRVRSRYLPPHERPPKRDIA